MTPLAWLSVVGLCTLGAMSPGPSLAMVLYHSGLGSRQRGISCALAHSLGVGVYALLTALGLAALLARHAELYRLVSTAGALYLLWLGLGLLRPHAPGGATASARSAGGQLAAARDGLVTALVNPKIALFYIALFSQFVGPQPDLPTVVLLVLIAVTVDAGWYVLVALSVSATGLSGSLRRYAQGLDRVFGWILLLAAIALLYGLWAP